MPPKGMTMSDGLPPGPRLPVALQTLLVWGFMKRFLAACQRRYGPIFTIRAAPVGTLVYISDADDLRAVFTGDPKLFRAGEGNVVFEPVMGEQSLLRSDGDEHLQTRRAMLPPFHGDAVREYGELIEKIVLDRIDQWPIGTPFALHPHMHAITLEVMMCAVIGVDNERRLDELRPELRAVAALGGPVMLMWLWPGLGRFGRWRRYRETHARAENLLHDEIRARRNAPGLDERTDVLSILIRSTDLSDRNLSDQLMTLLLAGHETTATALSWMFERLLRHPAALRRLEESLAAGEEDYMDAVIKETLRVRPVVFAVARKLAAPAAVGGYRLPAGITVMPALGLVQNRDVYYPDATSFEPERFLGKQAPPYTWVPFGGGTRRCIGAPFSLFEMSVVLRTVLAKFELRASSPQSEAMVMRHVTHTPARGAEVVAVGRRTAAVPADAPVSASRAD